ncbi:MAG: PAS domain S-box protein [Desulfuromonadales bacterium]|nr:PAS domain S-box protein [Desulfuromonadales bacterium]
MKRLSLKTRITVLLPVSICILLAVVLLSILFYFEGTIKETITTQQNLTVSILADEIDQKLLNTQQPLTALASKLTPEQISDPDEALAFLLERTEFTSLFDNGMFLFNQRGQMVAELPLGVSRTGKDFSFRDYLRVTLATQAPHISDPYISSQDHHNPVIMLTAPIFDSLGNLVAVLGGSTDLTKANFPGRLNSRKIGKTGYLFLVDTNRVIISHPDPARISKPAALPGANQLLDRAIKGFEGTEIAVNSDGIQSLTSFKRLRSKNWILGASYPTAEAFTSITRLRNVFTAGIIPLLLVLFFIMRNFFGNISKPLLDFTSHVKQLQTKTGSDRLYPESGISEISTLETTFNQLIAELDSQQQAMDLQNKYLLALHETTLGLISRLELHSLLSAIISRAATLMQTEHGYIYLHDKNTNTMITQVQIGIFATFDQHSLQPGEGLAGHVWKSGKPYHVDDYNSWPGRLPDPKRNSLHAMAGVPLTSGGEIVGVIGVAFIDPGMRFSEANMDLLCSFAKLASLALDNARLYEAAQKELEERNRIEESWRKLSHVVEQSPVSIMITDLRGTIEYANPHVTNLTGYTLQELLGQNPSLLKSGFTSQSEYVDLWQTILAGGKWSGEFQNIKKNGDLYWELATISPLRNQSGQIIHFIAIKEDITERKSMENQLLHSQKLEAVGQLAGGIAHDFNNILTAIIGYATVMQKEMPADSPYRAMFDQLLGATRRGSSLTQGLLSFSRKQPRNPRLTDVNMIVEGIEKLLRRLLDENSRFIIELSAQPLPIMADTMQIEQVLMNLVTNARDALPGEGIITITTKSASLDAHFVATHGYGSVGRFALLTVSDTGQGISAETIKHIFEPFYTTKETGKGTGLGLSIAYGIIKTHGGYIFCHSSPNEGTTFSIYLPLSDVPEDAVLQKTAEAGHEISDVILLVDDCSANRELTRDLLQEFGYKILEAENGEHALEKYRGCLNTVRLAILDMDLPDIWGKAVYQRVRGLNPDIRVLMCAGADDSIPLESSWLSDTGLYFINKPIKPKELLMKIKEVLEDVP